MRHKRNVSLTYKNIIMKFCTQILFFTLLSLIGVAQSVDLQREAELMPELYSISGDAFLEELSNGDLQLRLSSNFTTPAGPDVRIILNSSVSGSGGVEIVNLSSIGHFNGELTVPVPSSVDIEDYDFIVFFCVAFNQLWASGEFGDTINLGGGGPTCEVSEVENASGSNVVDICPSDNNSDVIEFENSLNISAGSEYAYLITDANQILQEVVLDDEYDFEGSSTSTQRVYGIHYAGILNSAIGSNRMNTTATDCFEHSNNSDFITITKNACFECEESDVLNDNGPNNIDICPSDNIDDIIEFDNTLNVDDEDEYVYLITDENEILQEVIFDDNYNFEGTSSDEQRVYGMHYEGTISEAIGSHRLATTASGCEEHSSDNVFITITKNACIPAFVCMASGTSALGGTNLIDVCPNDGSSDIVSLDNTLNLTPGANYAYLITDANEILQEVVFTTAYNFEGSTLDEQRVYGVHYDGILVPAVGSHRVMTTASGCAEHSSATTFLTITKNACIPAFVCQASSTSTIGGVSTFDICPNDGSSDILSLTNSINVAPGVNYAYLITDANEILQEVVFTTAYNFEGSTLEEQRVYGVHYDGILTPAVGSVRTMTTASGCIEHSSSAAFVTVTKDACIPAFVCDASQTSTTGNVTQVNICPSDGNSDIISFQNSLNAAAGVNYAYLITDANQILQEVVTGSSFNFEGTGNATQRVYGVHFDGNLIPQIGQNRMMTTATECHMHSSATSFLSIIKDACPPVFNCLASTVASTAGTALAICAGDGTSDLVTFTNNIGAPAGQNYAYLLTNTNDILLEVINSGSYDFEQATEEQLRVYGVHFSGNLQPQIGLNRLATSSTECFSHSSANQFVTVTTTDCAVPFECVISTVGVSGQGSSLDICPADGVDDVVTFVNNLSLAPGENYVYLLTDENEILQEVVSSSTYNFEGSSSSQQRVYGLHYSGQLDIRVGAPRRMTTSSDCFAHSSPTQFVTITKNACPPPFECITSFTATTNWESSTDLCPSDGQADLVELRNSIGMTAGDNYAYLITNEADILQVVVFDNFFNFEGSTLETQRVYGVHFDGSLLPAIGQSRRATTATGCIAHSEDNRFLTVTKGSCIIPFSCEPSQTSTSIGSTISVCTTDGQQDVVEVNNTLGIVDPAHYAYLLTDASDILQAVTTESSINVEGINLDEIRIYGIHFDGTLTPAVGQNRLATTASGCHEHSSASSFVTIINDACAAPFECRESLTATTDWAVTIDICPSDGTRDMIPLRNNLFVEPGEHYAYLITDTLDVLQEVTFDSLYNFEGSSDAPQRVYGVHFDGVLEPMVGANRLETTATGCFTHSGSNIFLTVTKNACASTFECVETLTATTAWVTSVDVCAGDGQDDFVVLKNNVNQEAGEHYAYLVTDAFEVLQEIVYDTLYNFEASGIEEQRVYGISFAGDIIPAIGEHRRNTVATDCYIHSGDNLFITINKSEACAQTATVDLDAADDISIYPNPSSGAININYEESEIQFDIINIYDVSGMKTQTVRADSRAIDIETPGIYFLQFSNEETTTVKRVIIQ